MSLRILRSWSSFHTYSHCIHQFYLQAFYDTPCANKDIFQPGNGVENCEIVRTSATAPPTTSSTTLIVAVGLGFAVLALLALVVLLLRKNKSGEDEGVNATENEMTEGHELTEIQREEIEGLEVSV